ncbi:anti-repressor SinI family protein [Bacillus sp. FJAT-53711]|uniref:anti-repressor SinI family protein n=1 Tax=Bacillus yunxiaonensis TaxID=3127665 RepID=UPI0030141D7F
MPLFIFISLYKQKMLKGESCLQTNENEILDQEWIDLLAEALDMNINIQEIVNFLKHANQGSQN